LTKNGLVFRLGDEPDLDLATTRGARVVVAAGTAGCQQRDRDADHRGPPAPPPSNAVVHTLSLPWHGERKPDFDNVVGWYSI
jgi:hypothetical protein